ncbi:MAG TPA: redoxin domain-containing protein [Gaiellaceae bacterium]|nr:redoxin domain-containing protein [Gaiellaceae bacterium]
MRYPVRPGRVREPGRGCPRREPGQRGKARQVQGEVQPPLQDLADEDHAVAEQYGVWVEKSTLGKKYTGIERSTFVIDADGCVAKIMRKVKPATHADDVLAALPS